MGQRRLSLGVRLRAELVEKLDKTVKALEHLNSTRSELIGSIIEGFFTSELDHIEKGRELVILNRKQKNVHPVHDLSEKPEINKNF